MDFDLDIETGLPRQEFYNYRLKHYWGKHIISNTDLSKDFMYYALCHLPEGSFINFSFDEAGEYFMQFANMYGNIGLDISLLPTNHYCGQGRKIIRVLQSMHLENVGLEHKCPMSAENKFWITKDNKNRKTIEASFGKFHIWAGATAVVIIEEIFKIKEPLLFNFETARLVPVV